MPTQMQMEGRRPALRRAATHAHRYTPLSLDEKLPMGERVTADWDADPAAIAAEVNEREHVRAALHHLTPRQRHVVALHYFRGKSLHQIGQALEISPQRASQLHSAAIRNLKSA